MRKAALDSLLRSKLTRIVPLSLWISSCKVWLTIRPTAVVIIANFQLAQEGQEKIEVVLSAEVLGVEMRSRLM